MKIIIPHTIGTLRGRSLLFMGLFFLWSVTSIYAQLASDFDVKVTPTPSTCLQNGQVKITVTKKTGTATNYTYKAYYNLLNADGKSVTHTAAFVENNIITNLFPGKYNAQVRIKIVETGQTFDLGPYPIAVGSTYENLVFSAKAIRKSLQHYIPEGSTTPQSTGIFAFRVSGGKGPYQLNIVDAPMAYKGKRTIPMTQSKTLYIYEAPVGTYKFSVSDNCGSSAVEEHKMEYVRQDLPINETNGNGDVPFAQVADMTSEMRERHCGWFRVTYSNSVNINTDLIPYVESIDTLAQYYDFAWQTPARRNAGEKRDYHPFFETKPFGAENYGSDKTALYYKLPDGVNYEKAGMTDEYWPNIFIKVKGSTEEMKTGYRVKNYNYDKSNYSSEYKKNDVERIEKNIDLCRRTYKIHVRPRQVKDRPNDNSVYRYPILLCLPIKVTIVSKSDPTKRSETWLYKDTYDYTEIPLELNYNESYTMTVESLNGRVVIEELPAKKYQYYLSSITSKDHCEGIVKFTFTLSRRMPSRVPLGGHTIKLVSAPEGFKPQEGALKVGESYTLPASVTSDVIYPLSPKAMMDKSYKLLPDLAAGNYVYEINDGCESFIVSKDYKPEKVERYSADTTKFKPRITYEVCGRIRIYPFPEGDEGIFLIDGISQQPYFQIEKLPQGISWSNVRSNITDAGWIKYWVFTSRYKDNPQILKPEDIWFDFPVTEGTMEIRLMYSASTTRSRCLPTVTLPVKTPRLTYDRNSYVGYACPSGTSGRLKVVPLNCVGNATIELFDVKTGESKYKRTIVDKKKGLELDLKGTRDNPIPSTYKMVITDEECKNTTTEIITIYSLGSPSIIYSKGNQHKFCEGDPIELEVVDLGDVQYKWILPNGKTSTDRKLVIDKAEISEHSGTYRMQIYGIICDGAPTPIEVQTQISVAPTELWWREDAEDQNWNNLNNWSQADGKPIKAVPAPCTVVHIPAKVANGYPDLSAQSTNRDIFGDPVCSDIYFHYGSQLGTPQQLTYERAFVDYNFGKMSNGGAVEAYQQSGHQTADSKLLDRDRWYMVATPLNNMVSGDFSLAGYPKTYQRYLVASQSPNSITDVTFTRPFDTMVQTFAPPKYYHALALKVAGWETGRKGYDDHKHLNQIEGIIRIPFFADASRKAAYPLHSYDEAAGISTFRYYNEETLAPLAYTETANRGKGIYPYRFVYERYNATKPTSSQIATINDGGATLQGYALSVSGVAAGSYFMVGNPFMTPIDFDKLLEFNKDVIYPYYYVFEDNKWMVYSVETPSVSTRGKAIAPLQAVLLRSKSGSPSELRFPTSGAKSVLLASWSLGEDLVSVQDAATPYKSTTLPIHLQMGHGGDAPLASAYVMWDAEGDNIPALGNNEYSESPLVYVVDTDCGEGEMVLYPKRETGRLDVGVRASYASEMVLDFSDMDKSLYEYMTLTDRKSGREQDLLRNPEYRFVHELGVADPRFTLQLKRYGVPTAVEEPADAFVTPEISIHTVEESCIVQANQPIALIEVYDLSGQQVYRYASESNAQTLEHAISLRELPRSMVVKVYLENGFMDIRKVQF